MIVYRDFIRVATVSKDGSWKLWNIDGEFICIQYVLLHHRGLLCHFHCSVISCLSQKGRTQAAVVT